MTKRVEVKTQRELERLLYLERREVSIAIAARAALRVLPSWIGFLDEGKNADSDQWQRSVLILIRCVVAARFVAGASDCDIASFVRHAAGEASRVSSIGKVQARFANNLVLNAAVFASLAATSAIRAYAPFAAEASVANAALIAASTVADAATAGYSLAGNDAAERRAGATESLRDLIDLYGTSAHAQIWHAVSDDLGLMDVYPFEKAAEGALWREVEFKKNGASAIGPRTPDWAENAWYEFRAALLARGAHWRVWVDWYEAILNGYEPWNLPRAVGNEVTHQAVTWPEDKWQRTPAEVNAEIQALIDAARERLAAALLLADTTGDSAGRRWIAGDNHFQMAAGGDDTDMAAAQDADVIRRHAELKKLASGFAGKGQRFNTLGRENLAMAADGLATILECEPVQLPERIKAVYDASLSIASYLEEDNDLRGGNGGPTNLSCLPSDLRREFVEIVRRLGPWVRSFPTARKEDDELGGFLVRPELFEPTKAFIAQATSGKLITQVDSDHILQLIAAQQRNGEVASKAAKRGVLTGRNLAFAFGSVLGTLILSGYANESPLIKKTSSWLVEKGEKPLVAMIETMAPDVQQAFYLLLEDLKNRAPNTPVQPDLPRFLTMLNEAPRRPEAESSEE